MRTWQYDPPVPLTTLERAVMDSALRQFPYLGGPANAQLLVHQRDWTGVGLFTNFVDDWLDRIRPRHHRFVSLDLLIEGEGIEVGAGALIFLLDDRVLGLEMFSHTGSFPERLDIFTLRRLTH